MQVRRRRLVVALGVVCGAIILSLGVAVAQPDSRSSLNLRVLSDRPDATFTLLAPDGSAEVANGVYHTVLAPTELSDVAILPTQTYFLSLPTDTLTDVTCDDTGGPNPSGIESIVVDLGEHVTCTLHVESAPAQPDSGRGPSDKDGDPDGGLSTDQGDAPAPDHPTPLSGRWRSAETGSAIVCPFPIKAQNRGDQTGKLIVKRDGEELTGTGFGTRAKLKLKRRKDRPDHFVGKANVREGGVRGKLSVDWTVRSPEHMIGTNELSVKIQGKTCTITRTFEMHRTGN